jgi:ketosteroid isomerase-like protein
MEHDLLSRSKATEARTVGERFLDAMSRADVEALLDCLAEDVVWRAMGMDFMPHGSRYEGKDVIIRDWLPDAIALYEMSTWHLEGSVVAVGGRNAVIEWVVRAKAANGRDYINRYCLVVVTGGGKVREVREYTDTRYLKRVLIDD